MSADQRVYFMEATQSQERTTQKDYREQSLILSQFVFPTAKEENISHRILGRILRKVLPQRWGKCLKLKTALVPSDKA